MRLISKRLEVDIQAKLKIRILFIAIICLIGFQIFSKPAATMDDMLGQRRIQAKTDQTLKTQPTEPKKDDVLAIPGLPLKLRSGSGCAVNADHDISRRVVETHPFEIEEICFGDTKGPDIKHDFKWFKISGVPLKGGYPLPPGLVLSLYPGGSNPLEDLRWKEITERGFVEWDLIKKLPKFTMVGLKYHRKPNHSIIIIMDREKTKSFKWEEKVYDCSDPEKPAPPGFRHVFLYDYCWFEKTTGPEILPESF